MSAFDIEQQKLIDQCRNIYRQKFETNNEPTHCAIAPGRVNLIGDHVDYCDGIVLPMAIPLYTVVVGRAATTADRGYSRVYSDRFANDAIVTLNRPYTQTCDAYPDWIRYVRGIVASYTNSSDFDAVIVSTVPLGGGLSSSASLEIAMLAFLRQISNGDDNLSVQDCALMCQSAEHKYAGTPCGIMDQFVVSFAKQRNALKIDCRSLTCTLVPMTDTDTIILVTNSNVKHELSSSEYKLRRADVESAAKTLKISSLRDILTEELTEKRNELSETIYKRSRHVVSEIARTESAIEALQIGDMHTCGKLMSESHRSLRDDYNVSCAELDELVSLSDAYPGVYGSRMTGGGFGGCIVSLVKANCVDGVEKYIQEHYHGSATFYRCVPVDGVRSFSF